MIREATALLGVGRDTQLGSLTQEMQAIPRKKKKRSMKRALQQSLLIRVRSMAPSLLTHCTILHLSHLSRGSQTNAISPPHPKLPISFDLFPGVQPVCTQHSGSKQHGRVIPNEVARTKVLNGRLRSLPPPKLSYCIHMEHVTAWVKF